MKLNFEDKVHKVQVVRLLNKVKIPWHFPVNLMEMTGHPGSSLAELREATKIHSVAMGQDQKWYIVVDAVDIW